MADPSGQDWSIALVALGILSLAIVLKRVFAVRTSRVLLVAALASTFSGCVRTFAAVAFADPESKSAVLSRGISEFMYGVTINFGPVVLLFAASLMFSAVARLLQPSSEPPNEALKQTGPDSSSP